MRFLDEVKIYLKAGDGGKGCIAFHREKYLPKGGPSGGNGGRGGSLYLQASENLHTLNDFLHWVHFKAPGGQHGMGSRCSGHNAKNVVLHVPRGTIVTDPDRGQVLADLVWHGQIYLAARGGAGGRGNASFASHSYRLPRFAEQGEPGEECWLRLILKMIAQVGIVGLPNAGKSTLLSKISRATPRIAPYPFTTLVPNLGLVWLDDSHRAIFADIPGLVEGAHAGVGLGDRFLRHVERTRVLVHLIDSAMLPAEDPLTSYRMIREELRQYGKSLDRRPEIVVLNKADLEEARTALPTALRAFHEVDLDPLVISAEQAQGLGPLMERVRDVLSQDREAVELGSQGEPDEMLDSAAEVTGDESPTSPIRPPRETAPRARFTVRQEGERYIVEGRGLERMVAMADLSNDEAVQWLTRRLERMGVEDALRQAGAVEGSPVVIRGFEFELQDEKVAAHRPTRKQKRMRER